MHGIINLEFYRYEVTEMAVSYNKLWKLLIDKKIKKMQLRDMACMGSSTLAKLGKDQLVSMDVIMKICNVLTCDIGDVMEILPEENKKINENR